MSIDPNNLASTAHVTFDDEFNSLSLWNGTSGTWGTTFWYDDPNGSGSTLAGNGEQEWYINANYAPTAAVKPWTVADGVLTLTAAPASSTISNLINGYTYTSGEVNTFHSFSQEYGYFEMRAQLPAGQGFWPAFWLLPSSGAWPPELDIMEVLANNPSVLYTTAHTAELGYHTQQGQANTVADTSVGYHTYGLDWEADYVTWYFDGQQIFRVATPADMHQPMYILANLAAGGYWPGSTDGVSTARMNVDYIRAFASGATGTTGALLQSGPSASAPASTAITSSAANVTLADGVTSVALTGTSAQTVIANNAGDTIYSTNNANHLVGGAGDDTFYIGRAGDMVTGGGGHDTFVFNENPWWGGHITDFAAGEVIRS
jgi:beta-glucanase (GH16 family)